MSNEVSRTGIGYALLAYTAWGFFPIYWSFLHHVPSYGILAHRIVWSFAFYFGFVALRYRSKGFQWLLEGLKSWKLLVFCSIFIGLNWWLYVWAVNHGHVLETSLGYFISPLVNIGLGVFFLKEKLNRYQKTALWFAVAGVVILSVGSGEGLPWIALGLAFSFGIYGLLRKKLTLNSFVSSSLESFLLIPGSLFWFANPEAPVLDTNTVLLLAIGGAVTGLPLIWFSEAAKRIPLSVMGFFQYIAPTIQFFCAVLFFKERFTPIHAYSFAFIWTAIFINLLGLRRVKR